MSTENSKLYLPPRIVECECVDNISVLIEREEFLASHSVPNFAGAIIATSDESASAFVEGTVSEWKQVGTEHLEEAKALALVLQLLLNESLNQLLQVRFATCRNKRFLEQDLVN